MVSNAPLDDIDGEAEAQWQELLAAASADSATRSTRAARTKLALLGARAVPTLLRGLEAPESRTRYEALYALHAIGPAGARAGAVLEARIPQVDGFERTLVVTALCSVTNGAPCETELATRHETRQAVMEWVMTNRHLAARRQHVERLLGAGPDAVRFVLRGDDVSMEFGGLCKHADLVVPDLVKPLLTASDLDIRQAAGKALMNARVRIDAEAQLEALASAGRLISIGDVETLAFLEGSDVLVDTLATQDAVGTMTVLARRRRQRGLTTALSPLRRRIETTLMQRDGDSEREVADAIELATEVEDRHDLAPLVHRAASEHERHYGWHIEQAYVRFRWRMGGSVSRRPTLDLADERFLLGEVRDFVGHYADGRYDAVLLVNPRSAHAAFQLAWIARAFGALVDDRWAAWIASLGFSDAAYLEELRRQVPPLTGLSIDWRAWPAHHAEDEKYFDRAGQLEAAGLWTVAARHLRALAESKRGEDVTDLEGAARALESKALEHLERVWAAVARTTRR